MSHERDQSDSTRGIKVISTRATAEIDAPGTEHYYDIVHNEEDIDETAAIHGINRADIVAARELIALNEEVTKARKYHKKIRPEALARIAELEDETRRLQEKIDEMRRSKEASRRAKPQGSYIAPKSDLDDSVVIIDAEEDPDDTINKVRSKPTIKWLIGGATGLLAVSALCAGIIGEIRDRINENDASQKDTSALLTSDASPVEPGELPTCPQSQEVKQAGSIWEKVQSTVESKPESASLSASAKIRLEAETTNDLVASLHTDDKTWSDSPAALADLKGKVKTWGGYDALLASAEAGHVNNISEWIAYLDSDTNIPHRHLVADNFEAQIQQIQDSTINPDQKPVQAKLASVKTEQVNKVVAEKLANPPEIPKAFVYPSTASQSALGEGLYDAPEPKALLADLQSEAIPDVSHLMEEDDSEDLSAFLQETHAPKMSERFDAIEPGNFTRSPEKTSIPTIGNPFEAIEPANLLKVIPDVTQLMEDEEPEDLGEFLEEIQAPTIQEEPKKGIIDSAVSKVSGWFGAAKKWFS